MKPSQDDIDRELQQLSTAEPSPSFVAQVRTAVANQPTPSRVPGIFIAWAVGVAAAVLVAVAVYVTGPTVDITIASTPYQYEEVDKTPVPDAMSASPPAEAAPRTRIRTKAQRIRPEPSLQVMVSPDDRQAFERLVLSTKDGTVALSFEETNDKLTIAELTIAPITTEPLAISELQGVVQ